MEGEKRKPDAEASSSTISKRQRPSDERESGSPLPDSPEKINEPSESEANSEPPASYADVIGNNYYVFLSFRGPDTRKGFVDHLYHELARVGLHLPNFVFRDDEKLRPGEPIKMLLSAIKCSKVSIPVISETYAASQWCLREIIQIMECVKSGKQKVYPVLYKVTPGDVRDMKGKFGDAFRCRKHEFDKEVKRKGPVALSELVDSKVYESEKEYSGHEGKLVKELVRIIMDERQQDFIPPLLGNLVGIDDRVSAVMKLVDTDPSETRIIGIYGIGGIGKTTLITNIYDKLSKKFEHRSFLMDIRETINRKGIEHIQSLLSSDIRKDHESRVRDPVSGIENVQISCKNKKVLIILDDVGHREHLDKLIDHINFKSGSRIIITCRNKEILKSEYKTYGLKELEGEDPMLLFSSYAYEEKQPRPELGTLPRDIVATTGGLPLALKTIGSLLKGKVKSIWTETLQKLSKVPHTDVQQKLRTSYDSLEYEQRQMFLDIACFFIGTNKRFVAYLWKDLQYFPDSGLERMIKHSLMKIDDNDKLRMHDQLRDLGRAIACPANKEPWKCSRLWDEKATIVQLSKEENRNIEALRLDKNGSIKFMERESFRRMPYLKFLHLSEVDFVGDFGDSLSELRWLEWEMCPGSFNATSIYLVKLQVLDLSGGFISESWEGWNSIKMERLKVLNLSQCSKLKSTPNLSALKNLEMLILEDCAYLEKIDPSIGDVTCLISLNLRRCNRLIKLPEQLGKLENLEELVIDETKVLEIPPCIGFLKKLKTLSANRCFRCFQLTEVPSSKKKDEKGLNSPFYPRSLFYPESLLLEKCSKLQWIPSSIGELGELVLLDLSSTGIKKLPESIGKLNKLKILNIHACQIEMIPSSIGKLQSLQELNASDSKLKGPILLDKGGLSSLKTLDLSGTKISHLPENLDQLSSLDHLDLLECDELESLPKPPFSLSSLKLTCKSNELPSLSHLTHLQELSLQHCRSLQSIPELPSCILFVYIWNCPKLEWLANLSDLKLLSKLVLEDCYRLEKLDGLEALESLRELSLPLDIDEMGDHLHAIKGLEKLGSLEKVCISGRKHIEILDLSKSEHLKSLMVDDCKRLVEIRCPSTFLELFDRRGCESLTKLPGDVPHD